MSWKEKRRRFWEEREVHSTNVSHFQRKLMDGKLFSNSIIFCCKWLTLVRSNHALVNKRSDFFLTGVAFCFKCIIVGYFVTGFKVTATPLQRAVNSFFQIFQPINVGGPAGFWLMVTDQKQQQNQSGARKKRNGNIREGKDQRQFFCPFF